MEVPSALGLVGTIVNLAEKMFRVITHFLPCKGLEFELLEFPGVGTKSSHEQGGINPSFYAKIRITNNDPKGSRSIVELQIYEGGGLTWRLESILSLSPTTEEKLQLPLHIPPDKPLDFHIRAYSPTVLEPTTFRKEGRDTVGRLRLEAKDHRKGLYKLWLTKGETKIKRAD